MVSKSRLHPAERVLARAATSQGAATTVVAWDFNAYAGEPTVGLMKTRLASDRVPTPVNTWDPSPPGCLDCVFASGVRLLDGSLALGVPYRDEDAPFPFDRLRPVAKLEMA